MCECVCVSLEEGGGANCSRSVATICGAQRIKVVGLDALGQTLLGQRYDGLIHALVRNDEG